MVRVSQLLFILAETFSTLAIPIDIVGLVMIKSSNLKSVDENKKFVRHWKTFSLQALTPYSETGLMSRRCTDMILLD